MGGQPPFKALSRRGMRDLCSWPLSFFFFSFYRTSLTEGGFFSEQVFHIFQVSVNCIPKSFQDNHSGSTGSSTGCLSKEDSLS